MGLVRGAVVQTVYGASCGGYFWGMRRKILAGGEFHKTGGWKSDWSGIRGQFDLTWMVGFPILPKVAFFTP
jgi:hypothetical protein